MREEANKSQLKYETVKKEQQNEFMTLNQQLIDYHSAQKNQFKSSKAKEKFDYFPFK